MSNEQVKPLYGLREQRSVVHVEKSEKNTAVEVTPADSSCSFYLLLNYSVRTEPNRYLIFTRESSLALVVYPPS